MCVSSLYSLGFDMRSWDNCSAGCLEREDGVILEFCEKLFGCVKAELLY